MTSHVLSIEQATQELVDEIERDINWPAIRDRIGALIAAVRSQEQAKEQRAFEAGVIEGSTWGRRKDGDMNEAWNRYLAEIRSSSSSEGTK